ncbi:MAG: hypothetical protein ACYCPA_13960 [Acidithiobacillus sp.]
MPIIDRIIPQDAGTIEAGSTINKSQQILDEEEALAAKKKRLAEQDAAVKPNIALPAIPKADKPEKVLDADGRVKHIDHGDKIRVPFTSMIGFGKAAATRREQFVGEALDKMAERVGPDRNLKIHGNRVFMETAIKHAVANGIPLECPEQKWQKEYERALSHAPKQKLAFGVAGSVTAGGAAPLAVQTTVEAPAPIVDVAESRTASLPSASLSAASPVVTAPEPVNEAPEPAKEQKTPLALQPVGDTPHESLGGIALVHDKKTGTYHFSVPDEHGHGVLVEPAISAEAIAETKSTKAVKDPALAEAMIRSMPCVPVDRTLKYSVYQFAEQHGVELHTQTVAGKKPQLDGVSTPALARHWEEKVREFNAEHAKENVAHKDKLVTFPDGRQMHADNGKFYTMALDLAEHVDIEKQRQASGRLLHAPYEHPRGNTLFHLARAGKPIMVNVPTKNLEVNIDSCTALEGKQVKLLLNKEGKLTVEDRSRNREKQQQKGQQI